MRILLDMDGVMIDFVSAACKAFGAKPDSERMKEGFERGEWNINKLFDPPVSNNQFWKEINEIGESFWTNMMPLPWLTKLIHLVEEYAGEDWYIVTSPSKHPSSYSGKVWWLKERFGQDFDRIVLTKHKHLLANRDTVLIDDKESTISKFRECNGEAILFPAPYNKHRDACFCKDELNFVESLLIVYKDIIDG